MRSEGQLLCLFLLFHLTHLHLSHFSLTFRLYTPVIHGTQGSLTLETSGRRLLDRIIRSLGPYLGRTFVHLFSGWLLVRWSLQFSLAWWITYSVRHPSLHPLFLFLMLNCYLLLDVLQVVLFLWRDLSVRWFHEIVIHLAVIGVKRWMVGVEVALILVTFIVLNDCFIMNYLDFVSSTSYGFEVSWIPIIPLWSFYIAVGTGPWHSLWGCFYCWHWEFRFNTSGHSVIFILSVRKSESWSSRYPLDWWVIALTIIRDVLWHWDWWLWNQPSDRRLAILPLTSGVRDVTSDWWTWAAWEYRPLDPFRRSTKLINITHLEVLSIRAIHFHLNIFYRRH